VILVKWIGWSNFKAAGVDFCLELFNLPVIFGSVPVKGPQAK
jgi:hypothetical protein